MMDNVDNNADGENNAGNSFITQLAGRFGLDPAQAQAVMEQLLPALSAGIMKNTRKDSVSSLFNLFRPGGNAVNDGQTELLQGQEETELGNNILGKILGSKDASRQVAQNAGQETGINAEIVKKMLPLVAVFAISMLGKRSFGAGPVPRQGLVGRMFGLLGGYNRKTMIANEVLNLLKQRK